MKFWSLTLMLLLTNACSSKPLTPEGYLAKKKVTSPHDLTISNCRGYGCQYIDEVELTKNDWKAIAKTFKPKPKTAEQERVRIKAAIGVFETIIGTKNKTAEDIHGTFIKSGAFQHDCVDESINTTSALLALQNHNLLQFHITKAPTARFPLIHSGLWPHQTAVIKEISTGTYFAVDSWFHDNGAPAEIVPLKQWKEGWRPEQP